MADEVNLNMRMPADLRDRLNAASARQEMPVSNVLRRLAREHCDALDAGLYPWVQRPRDIEHPDQARTAA